MTIKQQVSELLEKKMDRQDFLKTVALSVVAISGASAVFRTFTPKEDRVAIASGYGMGAYGGIERDGKLS